MNPELNYALTKLTYFIFLAFIVSGIVISIRIFIGRFFGK